jgi:hypothetical protein
MWGFFGGRGGQVLATVDDDLQVQIAIPGRTE